MPKNVVPTPVQWLGEKVNNQYEKFQFKNIIASVGDFVLISNADAAEPDTEEGCDAAQIISLYEHPSKSKDPFRAKVQWYCRPNDLRKYFFNNVETNFVEREILEDHRPFDKDVSIETFFKKCTITLTFTKDTDAVHTSPYHYLCRYRIIPISTRKVQIEPVLERERNPLQLLCTKINDISISVKDNWSVSKNNGTKLLLKRGLSFDKTESHKKATPKITSIATSVMPKNKKPINHTEEILSMELRENSNDEELPTLIIRQHIDAPTPNILPDIPDTGYTPKCKYSVSKIDKKTPKKLLNFEEEKEEYVTQSCQKTKSPKKNIGTLKRTPLKTRNQSNNIDGENCKGTPTRRRTKLHPTPMTTPTAHVRRNITRQLTPSLPSRAHPVHEIDDFIKDNTILPGRESQMEEVLSFVRTNLSDGISRCMYISGMPGTGKTATVCSALKILKKDPHLPEFQLVTVNGMMIADPPQIFVQIYKQLTGNQVVWKEACSLLLKLFTNPEPRRLPIVLFIDELDALCMRKQQQNVLYSITDWTSRNSALLTVLAVANIQDLPERLLAASVTSRVGLKRIVFLPYTHTQLQRIVATRLANDSVNPDAVQLIARKIAAVSGDARRALTLCTRALELAGPKGLGLKEVQQTLEEAISNPTVRAIRNCSPVEKLILRAVAAEVERTGTDETTLSRVLETAAVIVALDGAPYKSAVGICVPKPLHALKICEKLASIKLLFLEPLAAEPGLLLSASVDDVHYATKQITVY